MGWDFVPVTLVLVLHYNNFRAPKESQESSANLIASNSTGKGNSVADSDNNS